MKTVFVPTFETAFRQACHLAVNEPEHISDTRIGPAREILNLGISVTNPKSYTFNDPRINRISYDYASDFWQFMIAGGTDAQEAFKNYPNVARIKAAYQVLTTLERELTTDSAQ